MICDAGPKDWQPGGSLYKGLLWSWARAQPFAGPLPRVSPEEPAPPESPLFPGVLPQ